MQRAGLLTRDDFYNKIIAQSKQYWVSIYLKRLDELLNSNILRHQALDSRGSVLLIEAVLGEDGIHRDKVKCTQEIFNSLYDATKDIVLTDEISKLSIGKYIIDVGRAYKTYEEAGYSKEQLKNMKIMNVVMGDAIVFEAHAAVLENGLSSLLTNIAMDQGTSTDSTSFALTVREQLEMDFATIGLQYINHIMRSQKEILANQLISNFDIQKQELEVIIDELLAIENQYQQPELKDLEWFVSVSNHVIKIAEYQSGALDLIFNNTLANKINQLKSKRDYRDFHAAISKLNNVTTLPKSKSTGDSSKGGGNDQYSELLTSGNNVYKVALQLQNSGQISPDEYPTYTSYLKDTTALIIATKPSRELKRKDEEKSQEKIQQEKIQQEKIQLAFDKHCSNTAEAISDRRKQRIGGAMMAVAGAALFVLSIAFFGVTFGVGTPGTVIGVGLAGGLIAGGLAMAGVGALAGIGMGLYGGKNLLSGKAKEGLEIEMENIQTKAKPFKNRL